MTCRNRPSPQNISNCFVVLCVRIRRAPLNSDNKRRMSGQISRLTTVSHVLYDKELLDLRRENEALKHDLLWKERTLRKLRDAWVIYKRENTGDVATELRKLSTMLAYFEQTLMPLKD